MAYLDQFLSVIVKHGGSDLHIGEGEPPKMRMHGDIMPIRAEQVTREEAIQMMSEICGPHNWEIFEGRGDLDFAYEMDGASRFRSNYFKQSNGYGAVFRLIPTKIATLEELGIPVIVKQFAHLRGGLVLVTGTTGSGKTTTQAALVDYINQNFSKHVVTIEEPIEFVHDNKQSTITQREVPADSSSFPGRDRECSLWATRSERCSKKALSPHTKPSWRPSTKIGSSHFSPRRKKRLPMPLGQRRMTRNGSPAIL